MANYRPKSLDELGSLYDKSLEAENEIKKGSSKLEDKPVQPVSAFMPDEEAFPTKKTPQQIASDEIADKVGDFVKSFGSSTSAGKNPMVIPTVQSKPRPPRKKLDEGAGQNKKAEPVEPAKPKLIRDPERTSLFENYKKVMDDEDDYNFSETDAPKKRRLRRKKSDSKVTKEAVKEAVLENDDEIELQAAATVESVFEQAGEEKKTEEAPVKPQFKQISYEEYAGKKIESDAPQEEIHIEEKQRKNPVFQLVLMVMLLCVLISSIAIGSIKAFSGADSDKMVFGKYYVCTVTKDYSASAVKKGDLVIAENKAPSTGDLIAYRQNGNSFAFAKYETALNIESVLASDGGQQILVFNNELRGVVVKTIPVVGLVVSAIMSYFLPIMGLMLLLAALLVLLVFFVSKDTASDDEDEYEENDDEEYDEADEDAQETDEAQYEDEEYPEEAEESDEIEDELESLFTT